MSRNLKDILYMFFIVHIFLCTLSCSNSNKHSYKIKKNKLNFISSVPSDFKVIFDQSKEQIYSPFETGYSGMSILTGELKKIGASVGLNNLPLDKFLGKFSGPGKVLVLGVAMNKKYENSEIQSIKKFVESGGGVLVIVEHENLFGNLTFQNRLLENFDIKALPQVTLSKGSGIKDTQWPICSAKKFNLNNVRLYLPTPLSFSNSLKSFLTINNPKNNKLKTVGVINEQYKGKLIALGDAEILWNSTADIGIREKDNLKFVINLFKLLKGTPITHSKPASKKITANNYKKTVLFDTTGFGLIPDGSPFGLDKLARKLNKKGYIIDINGGNNIDYSYYDLVISACPVKQYKNPNNLKKAGQILLIGDGQADIISDTEIKKIFRSILHEKITNNINPANGIARIFGATIIPATVFSDNKKNHLYASAKMSDSNKKVDLNRSAIIEFKKNSNFKILAKTEKNTWCSNNITPFNDDNDSKQELFTKINGTDNLPVIAANEKIFIIADADYLTNQLFNTESGKNIYLKIEEWLDKPEKFKSGFLEKIFN